jgi:transcriptional regulator GlxA family with amidase domain
MFDIADQPPLQTLALLLLPGFAEGEAGLLADCVALLNQLAESTRYTLLLLSLDGQPVVGRGGRCTPVDAALDVAVPYSVLLVLASTPPRDLAGSDPALAALNQLARQRVMLGGVNAGAFWLAAAGLLHGVRATVHWTLLDPFSERHPHTIASSALFEIDHDRATCGGGASVADLFLHIVGRQLGAEITTALAELLLLDRIRGRDDRQRIPLQNQVGGNQPKLVQAVMLMEANLEEPLTTDEVAQHVCVSRRQLERLFKQHLEKVPSQYYLELRLNRARQMLRQTSKSIIQIGLSCGFSSGPHFSSAYRNHFGLTPREDRQRGVAGG